VAAARSASPQGSVGGGAQSEEELEDPEDDGDEEVPDDDVEGVDTAGFAEGESELAAGVEEDVDAGSEEDVVVLRLSLR